MTNDDKAAGTTGGRVLRNTGVLGVLFAFNTVAGFVGSVLLAHVLSVEELGRYGTAFRTYSWLTALGVFLLPAVLVRYVAELRGANRPGDAWRLLRSANLLQGAMVLVGVLGSLAWYFLRSGDHLVDTATWAFLLLAFASFCFIQTGESFLRGAQAFPEVALENVTASVVRLALLVPFAFLGGTVAWAMATLAGGNLAGLAATAFYLRRLAPSAEERATGGAAPSLQRRAVEYAATMGIGGLLSLAIWNSIEVFFMGSLLKGRPSLEVQLAFYTLAVSLSSLPVRLGKTISQALLPAFSELYGSGDIERLRRGYRQATVLTTVTGGYVTMLAIALAEPTFRLLFKPELMPAVLPFQLLLVPAIFVSINHAGGAALPALEGHRFFLVSTMILAPLNIGLDLLLIPRGEAVGAAAVNLIMQSAAVATGLWYIAVRRNLGFPAVRVGKAVLAGIVAAVPAFALARFAGNHAIPVMVTLAAAAALSLLLYAFALRLLRVLEPADILLAARVERLVPASLRPAWRRGAEWFVR